MHRLKVARRVREVLLDSVGDGARVLEVGAGDRRMGALLSAARRGVEYRSIDIDPAAPHDYRALEEIGSTFDCVFAFEVVEHLEFDEIGDWLRKLAGLVRPGGLLLLTTPNTYYPPAYLRDASHRTPLCYDELAGMVDGAGFRTKRILRIYHDAVHRALLRRWLFGWLFWMIGIDYARQIMLVAEREVD